MLHHEVLDNSDVKKNKPLKELTVDVHIPTDVGAPKRVGDLTGNWLCEERVIHYDLISVSRHFLYHTSSFGPPINSR